MCTIRLDAPVPSKRDVKPPKGASTKLGHLYPPLELPYFLRNATVVDPCLFPIRTVIKPHDFFIEDDVEQRRQIRQQERKMRQHYALERARRHAQRRRSRQAEEAQQVAEDAKRALFKAESDKEDFLPDASHESARPAMGWCEPQPPFSVSARADQRRLVEKRRARDERRADIINYRSMVMVHFQQNRNSAQSALSKTDVIHVDDVQRCFVSADFECSIVPRPEAGDLCESGSCSNETTLHTFALPEGRGSIEFRHRARAEGDTRLRAPVPPHNGRNIMLYSGVLPVLLTQEHEGERGYFRDILLNESSDDSGEDGAVSQEIAYLRRATTREVPNLSDDSDSSDFDEHDCSDLPLRRLSVSALSPTVTFSAQKTFAGSVSSAGGSGTVKGWAAVEDQMRKAVEMARECKAVARFQERRRVADEAAGAERVSPSAPFYTTKTDHIALDFTAYGDVDAELDAEALDQVLTSPSATPANLSLQGSTPRRKRTVNAPASSLLHGLEADAPYATEQQRNAMYLGKVMPTPSPLFAHYRRQVLLHEKVFSCVLRQGGVEDVRLPSDSASLGMSSSAGRSGSIYNPPPSLTGDLSGPLTPPHEKTFLYCLFATANNSQVFAVYQRQRIEVRSKFEVRREERRKRHAHEARRRHTLFNGGFTPMVADASPVGRMVRRRYGYQWVRVRIDMIRSMPDFADCIRSWNINISGHHTTLTADTSGGLHWSVFPNVEERIEREDDDNGSDGPSSEALHTIRKPSCAALLEEGGVTLTAHSMRPVCIARFTTPVMPTDVHIPQCVGVAYLEGIVPSEGRVVPVAGPPGRCSYLHDHDTSAVLPLAQQLASTPAAQAAVLDTTTSTDDRSSMVRMGYSASVSIFSAGDIQVSGQVVCVCGKSGMVGLYDVRPVASSTLFAGDPVVGRKNLFDISRFQDAAARQPTRPIINADQQRQLQRAVESQHALETFVEAAPMPIQPGSMGGEEGDAIVSVMEHLLGTAATSRTQGHELTSGAPPSAMDLLTRYHMRLFSRGSYTPPPPRLVHQFIVGGGGISSETAIGAARSKVITSMCHIPSQAMLLFGASMIRQEPEFALATVFYTHTYWGVPLSSVDAAMYMAAPLRAPLLNNGCVVEYVQRSIDRAAMRNLFPHQGDAARGRGSVVFGEAEDFGQHEVKGVKYQSRREAREAEDRVHAQQRACETWLDGVRVVVPPFLADTPPPYGARIPTEEAQFALCAARAWKKFKQMEMASSPRSLIVKERAPTQPPPTAAKLPVLMDKALVASATDVEVGGVQSPVDVRSPVSSQIDSFSEGDTLSALNCSRQRPARPTLGTTVGGASTRSNGVMATSKVTGKLVDVLMELDPNNDGSTEFAAPSQSAPPPPPGAPLTTEEDLELPVVGSGLVGLARPSGGRAVHDGPSANIASVKVRDSLGRDPLLRAALVTVVEENFDACRPTNNRPAQEKDVAERHRCSSQLAGRVSRGSRSSRATLVDDILLNMAPSQNGRPISLLTEIRRARQGGLRPSSQQGHPLLSTQPPPTASKSKRPASSQPSRTIGTGKLLHSI